MIELISTRVQPDGTRILMDALHILLQRPLAKVQPHNATVSKCDVPFIKDSFEEFTKYSLMSQNLIEDLYTFVQNEKDGITEETIELLMPYLKLSTYQNNRDDLVFKPETFRKISPALEGIGDWILALYDYN